MSGAERQRRYLNRLLSSNKAQAVEPDRAIARELTQTKTKLEQARTRIAELEKLIKEPHPATIPEQEQWHKPSAAERRIMQLEAKVRELEALVLPLDDTQKDALRQYKRKVNREYKARWRHNEAVIKQRTITMHSKDYALFIAGFHPDASAEMRDKARNRFTELFKNRVITDKDKVKWPPSI